MLPPTRHQFAVSRGVQIFIFVAAAAVNALHIYAKIRVFCEAFERHCCHSDISRPRDVITSSDGGSRCCIAESITVKRRIALAQLWPTHVKTFIDSYVGLRSLDRFIRPKTVVVIMDFLRFTTLDRRENNPIPRSRRGYR